MEFQPHSPRMSIKVRRAWLQVHRYLGLTVGLLFVFTGLTGSFLVFHDNIDAWLNPSLLTTNGSGTRRPLAELLSNAATTHSDLGPAHSIVEPQIDGGVYMVWFEKTNDAGEIVYVTVAVDPYTAEVKGRRTYGEDFVSVMYSLHYTLLAGKTGSTIIGVVGFVMMVSIASGLYLWWPIWMRGGGRAGWLIRRAKLTFDVHKVTGLASAVVLFVIAFTGFYMIFPGVVRPIVAMFSEVTSIPFDLKSKSAPNGKPLSADEVMEIGLRRYPDAVFTLLDLPHGAEGAYTVVLRQPTEIQQTYGVTRVFIDQYSGEILAVRDWNERTAGERFIAWQFPLHNGEVFGLAGRWIVFATGFTPLVLYVTGCMLWWRRHRSEKRRRERHPDQATEPVELEYV